MSGILETLAHAPTFNGDITSDEAARRTASRDASIFEVMPSAIIRPRTVSDVQQAVQYVTKLKRQGHDISLTPRAGGTCMSGGPLTQSIVLDVSSHLNAIGAVESLGQTVRVQGGAMHLDVERIAAEKGLFFAPYTSSRDICSIGGMIGNNASGEKSIKFGATSENVDRIKVVLADGNEYEFGPLNRIELEKKKQQPTFEGEVYRRIDDLLTHNRRLIAERRPRTKKNAAGYALWDLWQDRDTMFNLARLFIGAQGTLGVVTEAELTLTPLPRYARMIVTPIHDPKQLPEVVKTALFYEPVTCETFDHHTYNLAKQYHPEDAARAHIADGKHMVVLSVFDGNHQDRVDTTAGRAKEKLESLGYETFWIDDQATVESFLTIRRKSFKMLLEHPASGTRAQAFLEDTIVPLEHYGDFLLQLEAILSEYQLIYTYAGHIGDGSIRLIPLIDMEAPGAAELVMELETKVNNLVLQFGGSISVDHNDGIIRTPYLEKQFGPEMVQLFREVKQIFDPLGIFNPGKKVGGTFDYALEHIIRENGA